MIPPMQQFVLRSFVTYYAVHFRILFSTTVFYLVGGVMTPPNIR